MRQAKYTESLVAVNQLPPQIADSREFIEVRMTAAQTTENPEEYHRALETLARLHGADPSVELMLFDYYMENRQFDKMLTGVTMIENRIGEDGYTDMLKANHHFLAGEFAESAVSAQKAVSLEPDRRPAWSVLGSNYVRLKDYPRAAAAYQLIQSRFGEKLTRENFVGKPSFAEFVRSDAFNKWLPK